MLGDFNGAGLDHHGVTTTFSRNGDAFMVRTEGPDGALHDYEIAYTFGVYPLQQYLIAFPGGRYQALGVAWDAGRKIRAASAGCIFIRTRRSRRAARCIGPDATRPGIINARPATRRI